MKKCNGCRFWRGEQGIGDEESDEAYGKQGFCLRYPPVRTQSKKEESREEGNYGMGNYRAWKNPITLEHDWCGEFKPAEQELPDQVQTKTTVDKADLSTRTGNCIRAAGFEYVEDAQKYEVKMLLIEGFGRKSRNELRAWKRPYYLDSKSTTS